jgi:alpha-galactosidase
MISHPAFEITILNDGRGLWSYRPAAGGPEIVVAPPRFEIDGRPTTAWWAGTPRALPSVTLPHGPVEHRWQAPFRDAPDWTLELALRSAPQGAIVRFRYTLRCARPGRLTRTSGRDLIEYTSLSLADWPQATEVRLGEFLEQAHTFALTETAVNDADFAQSLPLSGPILAVERAGWAAVLAFEHGSHHPDRFVEFGTAPDRALTIRGVKGNYPAGQPVDATDPFQTIWLHLGAVAGTAETVAAAYRQFCLRDLSPNQASRQPYVFYNTWNYQERLKNWHGRPYLAEMNETRMLAEIDVAHKLGVDVFVIDTGWYQKTGDWELNTERFPRGLAPIHERLRAYGMKLGLWFAPTMAARSSRLHQANQRNWVSRHGERDKGWAVWETEHSYTHCLVSDYADAFAEELIRCHREFGVTYFKWDAVGQYGCDDPGHHHGGSDLTAEERHDCYAFQQPLAMARVVDRVCAACPEAIVDFDVTEGGRSFGLSFLAAGKYFLINNGPYEHSYNRPLAADGQWKNLFFHPGPARGWICRAGLSFDKWVPSVLFLTHYFPDDPASNQRLSVASLILGQNGIWGDLPGISPAGVALMGDLIAAYKRVRDDITLASPVRTGVIGGSPEIHEKINPANGRGVIVVFANQAGVYHYVSRQPVAEPKAATEGVRVTRDAQGRAVLTLTFTSEDAHIVYCGA